MAPSTLKPACFRPNVKPPQPLKRSMAVGLAEISLRLDGEDFLTTERYPAKGRTYRQYCSVITNPGWVFKYHQTDRYPLNQHNLRIKASASPLRIERQGIFYKPASSPGTAVRTAGAICAAFRSLPGASAGRRTASGGEWPATGGPPTAGKQPLPQSDRPQHDRRPNARSQSEPITI